MTNKEMLRRLEDAFVGETVNYFYEQKFSRVELDGKKYKELCEDLAKGAEYEAAAKIAINSVYGIQNLCKPYCEHDVELIKHYFTHVYPVDSKKEPECKVCELGINDMWPSREFYGIQSPSKVVEKAFKPTAEGFNLKFAPSKLPTIKDVNFISRVIYDKFGVSTPKVMFNEPATILQWGDFKTVVKCDEEDRFNRFIGLGIALYRYYRQHKEHKNQFNALAKGYMDLEQLAYYALDYFTKFEKSKSNKLINLVKHGEEGTWFELDI